MLVDGLDFDSNQGEQREVVGRDEWRLQLPSGCSGVLGVPELFGDRGDWGRWLGITADEDSFEGERLWTQGFCKAESERTTGKHLMLGIAWARGIGFGEMQFDLAQGVFRAPQAGCWAFGHHLDLVEPGAFAKGAERLQRFLVKIHQRSGLMREAFEFHIDS